MHLILKPKQIKPWNNIGWIIIFIFKNKIPVFFCWTQFFLHIFQKCWYILQAVLKESLGLFGHLSPFYSYSFYNKERGCFLKLLSISFMHAREETFLRRNSLTLISWPLFQEIFTAQQIMCVLIAPCSTWRETVFQKMVQIRNINSACGRLHSSTISEPALNSNSQTPRSRGRDCRAAGALRAPRPRPCDSQKVWKGCTWCWTFMISLLKYRAHRFMES